jgi:hypothetical protein
VIRAVVEGNESYAVLGLALTLAIEAGDVSETTFPVVTCQRLWERDIARAVQAPLQNVDLLGLGFLAQLSGEKAKAKAFLDSRQSPRDVRELAMRFALSKDRVLRERFKEALARFANELPFAIEELRSDAEVAAELRESAERCALAKARSNWAGSMLPARLAATVQRLADAKYPLARDQAQGLLTLLDALIDLGDRRSAALEQAEAFRGVQAPYPPCG